jgi:hypothetical protein
LHRPPQIGTACLSCPQSSNDEARFDKNRALLLRIQKNKKIILSLFRRNHVVIEG